MILVCKCLVLPLPPVLCSFGVCGECSVDQCGGLWSGQSSAHARGCAASEQHCAGIDSVGLGKQHWRLLFWHHHRSAGLPTDGYICLLWRHHFQHVVWSGFRMSGANAPNTCRRAGWTRRFADMDSCRIAGFVSGPVLCHRSTVPLPLGSGLWHLSPHLLCHLPYHCTSYRVWRDSCYVDLMLRPVWKMTTTTIYALFFTRISCNLCSTWLLPTEFLWLDNEIRRAKSAQGGLKRHALCLL